MLLDAPPTTDSSSPWAAIGAGAVTVLGLLVAWLKSLGAARDDAAKTAAAGQPAIDLLKEVRDALRAVAAQQDEIALRQGEIHSAIYGDPTAERPGMAARVKQIEEGISAWLSHADKK